MCIPRHCRPGWFPGDQYVRMPLLCMKSAAKSKRESPKTPSDWIMESLRGGSMVLSLLQTFFLLPLLVSLLVAVDDTKEATKEETKPFEMTRQERRLMELVNKERARADLPELRPHP